MEIVERHIVTVSEAAQVGDARRLAAQVAGSVGFSDVDSGRVAIAVTEAATNLVKHAGGGEILLRELSDGMARGFGLVAVDRGRGIANLAAAVRDGFSTSGTLGSGLGSIARQANLFDIYSQGLGTVLIAAFWPTGRREPTHQLLVGAICVPKPHQEVCGDDWAVVLAGDCTVLLAVDGLGHGPEAAEASRRAKAVFRAHATCAPAEIVERMHDALRSTRGAAAAVAAADRRHQVIRYAGIGNIAATVLANGATRSMVSHHGTLGHQVRRIQEFQYPWPKGALLFMQSDGVVSHWMLDRYPGLAQRHPMLIAAVLYRDCRRGNDDATVLVVRDPT